MGGGRTLHEDLSTFCFCVQNKFATKAQLFNTQYFYTAENDRSPYNTLSYRNEGYAKANDTYIA